MVEGGFVLALIWAGPGPLSAGCYLGGGEMQRLQWLREHRGGVSSAEWVTEGGGASRLCKPCLVTHSPCH